MKLYFVRHGESGNNAENKVTGTIDSMLTEKGRGQALDAKEIIKDLEFTHVFSSPLKRALETAEIIADQDIELWDDLHEVDYGICQDKVRPSNCRTNVEMTVKGLCVGGESLVDIFDRANRITDKLKELPGDSIILLVGHGTFTAVIFAVLEGKSKDELLDYRLNWTYGNAEVKTFLI